MADQIEHEREDEPEVEGFVGTSTTRSTAENRSSPVAGPSVAGPSVGALCGPSGYGIMENGIK